MFRRVRAVEGPRTLLNRPHRVTRLFRAAEDCLDVQHEPAAASFWTFEEPDPLERRARRRCRGRGLAREPHRQAVPDRRRDRPGRDPRTAPLPARPADAARLRAPRPRRDRALRAPGARVHRRPRPADARARRRDADRERQELCFHLPVLARMLERPRRARALPLSDQGARARSGGRPPRAACARAGSRRAPSSTTATRRATRGAPRASAPASSSRTRTCSTRGSSRTTRAWARTFQNLEYVVVDELHTYQRRLRLARRERARAGSCASRGSTARIPCSSAPRRRSATRASTRRASSAIDPRATIELVAITENGAPQGERRVFMFNPPVVNAELGIRASYVKQAVMLATRSRARARADHRVRAVAQQRRGDAALPARQGRARSIDAVARSWATAAATSPSSAARSSGSCATARSSASSRPTRSSSASTSATSTPSSARATRARSRPRGSASAAPDAAASRSICVLVTSSAPLDQYLAREPEYLLGAPVEEARIDPDNPEILIQHLKCAAFELPFRRGETYGDARRRRDARRRSSSSSRTSVAARVERHASTGRPTRIPPTTSRCAAIGWDNVVIIDAEHDKTIAEIDWRGAHTMLHEQAIYQHDGECSRSRSSTTRTTRRSSAR